MCLLNPLKPSSGIDMFKILRGQFLPYPYPYPYPYHSYNYNYKVMVRVRVRVRVRDY
jgi:hypothetical protein